jgi:hypothetical protein
LLHPKVIDLAAIRSPTVIGHIFGGIFADAGNNGNTGASGRVFEVTLIPAANEAPLSVTKSESLELNWKPTNGFSDLIEYSENFQTWHELTNGLSNTESWPISGIESPGFYRRLSVKPTSP